MNKTKQKILTTARQLFNEHGYSQVTIRMIAQELGMSSGNLNYHYKKREDIFVALYFEMVAVFDERVKQLPNTDISFAQIRNDIQSSMIRMIDYRFFWTDLYHLLKINTEVNAHFQSVYRDRQHGYAFLFAALQKQSLMLAPSRPDEYTYLAERMIAHSNTWIYSSSLYQSTILVSEVDQQAEILLMMIYPYLTKKGKASFE